MVLFWAHSYIVIILLGTIIRNFLISFHMYADDSQLYKSVSPNIEEDQLAAVIQLQNCISDISYWMNGNMLKINDFCLFIWGFTSLSTLYRSYHDG